MPARMPSQQGTVSPRSLMHHFGEWFDWFFQVVKVEIVLSLSAAVILPVNDVLCGCNKVMRSVVSKMIGIMYVWHDAGCKGPNVAIAFNATITHPH